MAMQNNKQELPRTVDAAQLALPGPWVPHTIIIEDQPSWGDRTEHKQLNGSGKLVPRPEHLR
jgi:hypothetical protein